MMPFLIKPPQHQKYSIVKRLKTELTVPQKISLWNSKNATDSEQLISTDRTELLVEPKQKKGGAALPEVIGWINMYFTSECVKCLIEQLEPSVHKFIKVPLRRAVFHSPAGPPCSTHESIEINYYIFAIGQHIPCIIKEQNQIMLSRTDDFTRAHTGIESFAQISNFAKHVINGKITAGAHIWTSKLDVSADQGTPTYIYCSDEFRGRFKGARYQGWSFQSVALSST